MLTPVAYNNASSTSLSLLSHEGSSMELSRRSDPGEFNLLLLINFVAIVSTFFTCTATTIAPIVALSCIFNITAAVVSLLLGILSGLDLLQSRNPQTVFAEHFMDTVEWAPHTRAILDRLFAKAGNVGSVSNLLQSLEYEERNDSTRCLTMNLDHFNLYGMDGTSERVCVSPKGSQWLKTTSPRTSIKKTQVARRLKGLEQNGILRHTARVDEKFLSLFGDLAGRAVDGLEEIFEKYRENEWTNGSIDYMVKSDDDDDDSLVEISILNHHII